MQLATTIDILPSMGDQPTFRIASGISILPLQRKIMIDIDQIDHEWTMMFNDPRINALFDDEGADLFEPLLDLFQAMLTFDNEVKLAMALENQQQELSSPDFMHEATNHNTVLKDA